MNPREERGVIIAALCKLKQTDEGWLVPSQTGADRIYRVNVQAQTCTCPDHSESGHKCKHLYAVEFTMQRELHSDGSVTETKTLTFTEKKKYTQNWTAYNAAQSVEKDRFQELLADLCAGIPEPSHPGRGRKPHSVRDSIFAATFKVYSTFGGRRFSSDLREAHRRGHIDKPIPGLKVATFLENAEYTPILKQLIGQSALPLRSIESDFAIDSSGFSTSHYERWYDEKYGATRTRSVWIKAHIACGVRTNVVTAVRVLDKDSADSPQFEPLLKETANGFSISEVSADKAYISYENFEAVAECGGTPFIDFKTNTTGAQGGTLARMFHYFQFRKDEFMSHYHKRSNVESAFSMVKRKFGSDVRSRNDAAMVNEVLCKFLCHNLCCLIQEQHELGIETVFWKPVEEPQLICIGTA